MRARPQKDGDRWRYSCSQKPDGKAYVLRLKAQLSQASRLTRLPAKRTPRRARKGPALCTDGNSREARRNALQFPCRVGFAASSHAKKNRIDAGFGGGGGRSDGGGRGGDGGGSDGKGKAGRGEGCRIREGRSGRRHETRRRLRRARRSWTRRRRPHWTRPRRPRWSGPRRRSPRS